MSDITGLWKLDWSILQLGVCVWNIPGAVVTPACTKKRGQTGGGSADKVHPFMAALSSNGRWTLSAE